jgi:hypothetical protein
MSTEAMVDGMTTHQNRLAEPMPARTTKAGWRVEEWASDCGLSRSYAYNLLARGAIESVHVGRNRIITTPPRDYLAGLAKGAA